MASGDSTSAQSASSTRTATSTACPRCLRSGATCMRHAAYTTERSARCSYQRRDTREAPVRERTRCTAAVKRGQEMTDETCGLVWYTAAAGHSIRMRAGRLSSLYRQDISLARCVISRALLPTPIHSCHTHHASHCECRAALPPSTLRLPHRRARLDATLLSL